MSVMELVIILLILIVLIGVINERFIRLPFVKGFLDKKRPFYRFSQ